MTRCKGGGALVLGLALSLSAAALHAQATPELRLSDGRIVEVIGLKRWTIPMIQDSLARYAPADSMQSHACAAVLRYKLHFADASTTYYYFLEQGQFRIVVTVREPQDSARVKYRRVRFDSVGGVEEWTQTREVLRTNIGLFEDASRSLFLGGPGNPPSRLRNTADSGQVLQLAAWFRQRSSDNDYATALRVLAGSPNMYDRTIAALILANFPERDASWFALVDAMLEPDYTPKTFASSVLRTLALREPRELDWTPRLAAAHAILDGTSLFLAPDFIDVLLHTGIGPAHARPLLKNGGSLLLEYLASDTPFLADRSHQLLVRLRGEDLGRSPAKWRAWIDGL